MSEQRSTTTAEVRCRAASTPGCALALATILAAVVALPADASDRWFTVEIVVFDDLRNEGLHAEQWPPEPGEPSLRNAIELTHLPGDAPADAVHAYRLVNPSQLALRAVWRSLRRSAHYRPLLHAGWRLPGLPRRSARPVHVGRGLGERGDAAADGAGGERPSVHGTVTVSLARFLQIEVDLLYRRPVQGEIDGSSSAPARFRLVSERRIRSGELHYVDHPLFGILMLLTPI